jgi:hypothetical protein
MVSGIEVAPKWGVRVCLFDCEEVFSHAVHHPSFSLAYILFATYSAADAVYEIVAFTVNIMFTVVFTTGGMTGYTSSLIYADAVSTIRINTTLSLASVCMAVVLVRYFGSDQVVSKIFWSAMTKNDISVCKYSGAFAA